MLGRGSRCGGCDSTADRCRAKSELRWQALASSLDIAESAILSRTREGCAFVTANRHKAEIDRESSVIDVALALADDRGVGSTRWGRCS